jgi:4-hydroxy-4-methyl-2-oxoglutarate aldolase
MAQKILTGRIAADSIKIQSTPKPPQGAVERFMALGGCTGIVSDVMDEMQIPSSVIGASVLRPTIPGRLICGPALTVRNIRQRSDPLAGAKARVNKMAEFEAHNLSEEGDVLVVQGVLGTSNMGGISALTGKRQGQRGAIVMGGVRDIPHSRSIDYPIWSSEITPATGKWRLETVEINGPIEIFSVRVAAGDLVLADDTGVCFIPREHILAVLELCEKKISSENDLCEAIDGGLTVPKIFPPSKSEAPP